MGYSRVDSQLLSRALCTWTFTGFANAGAAVLALHALTALVHPCTSPVHHHSAYFAIVVEVLLLVVSIST